MARAEFKKVVPVAAIAGKPGSVEAEHGQDFPGAKPWHEPVETAEPPAGGEAKIIIDDLDIPELLAAALLRPGHIAGAGSRDCFEPGIGLIVQNSRPRCASARWRAEDQCSSSLRSPVAVPAACSRTLARGVMILARLVWGIPRIGMVSNPILSWRDAVGNESRGAAIGLGRLVILLLLADTGMGRRVSPENLAQ
jgi:hypothetical protein